MYIIYNCGYYQQITERGRYTGKKYVFKKRFVTEVQNDDGKHFLKLTANDISWCQKNSKTIPPFMKLKDWCLGKEGRFDSKPFKTYEPEQYLKMFLLKELDVKT